jgi:hypothetical protein
MATVNLELPENEVIELVRQLPRKRNGVSSGPYPRHG